MKRFILAVLLSLGVASAFAVDFSADVGADTNLVFRGQTLSQRGLSGKFDGKASLDNGLYASYGIRNASIANTGINLMHTIQAGYSTKVFDLVNVNAGGTYYAFTGGAAQTQATAASNDNFSEGFVSANAYGFGLKYAQRVTNQSLDLFGNKYLRADYNYKFSNGVFAGAGYERQKFKLNNNTSNNYDATVGYSFNDKLAINATYVRAGNNVNGIKNPNQVSAGINYLF